MKKLLWLCLFLPAIAHADLRQPGILNNSAPQAGAVFNVSSGTVTDLRVSTATVTTLNVSTSTITTLVVTTATITNRIGTTTNNNATLGSIGEVISASVVKSAAIALTTTVPATIATMTLTAGDWDVRGFGGFLSGSGTTATDIRLAVSLTPNVMPAADTAAVPTANEVTIIESGASLVGTGNVYTVQLSPIRVSLAASTTIYLATVATFSVSTLAKFGSIEARRMR